VANPRHPEHFDDPASIPVLTDVIVPGRSPMPMPRPNEAYEIDRPAEPVQPGERGHSLPPLQPPTQEQATLTERDAEHIAERLRARFADYLREEGRRVIEARCREALEEHTSWLIRQVTREVALALEGEVMDWVRDAVREELAAHQASRR
jgi:hypothetical protein